MTKAVEPKKTLAKSLPFDQFSRQLYVSRVIDEAIRPYVKNKKRLEIIDLGGHKGKTSEFQSRDTVTILDIFDETYENYVKGDATKTTFKNNTFDVSCSFDVFEHIPRKRRQAFMNEALRISRYGTFLALPVDTDNRVSDGERLLNDFHKSLFEKDHPWLKEHIDYRIPTEEEIKTLVTSAGAEVVSVPSNQIGDWQLMQMLIFSSAENPHITDEVNAINTWYNQNVIELDANVDVGYRRIFFVSKDKKVISRVKATIKKITNHSKEGYETVHRKTFIQFSDTLAKISKKHAKLLNECVAAQNAQSSLKSEVESLTQQLNEASTRASILQSELAAVYGSKSWKVTKPLRGAKSLKKKTKRG